MIGIGFALLSLAIWVYLVAARGQFWRTLERDTVLSGEADVPPADWPHVVAVVPARDEAAMLPDTLGPLLAQDYPGRFSIVLVDDQSSDGTAELGREMARQHGVPGRLFVLAGRERPTGWTGKLWAMQQGLDFAESKPEPPDFILFCDADIAFAPGQVRRLVAGALARRSVLTSCMARLSIASVAERWLVPAFVFFFRKLYPFAWVAEPARRTAAAAGGCMLVRRRSLARAGGLKAIHGALIDDCAMGALMKSQGPIWLGLSDAVVSLRPYEGFEDIRRMVARSAYAQLHYSPLRLVGAVSGMAVTYLAPPAVAILGPNIARAPAVLAWALMAIAYAPTLRFYGLSPLRGLALPVVAAVYIGFAMDSAIRHRRGEGGAWKGRFQAAMTRGTGT